MQQSEQLGDFKSIKRQVFDQISMADEVTNLFIHKSGFSNILVRAPYAHKKTHCWRLKTLQITQYANNSGASEKAVTEIQFDGQLIFTLLDMFNQMMGRQILEYVENITNELRKWCDAPIKNVFLVDEKAKQSLGFKHGFIKITPVLFHIDHSHYFEYRCWSGEVDSQIPVIENAEKVQGTSNYYGMFDHICRKIQRYKKMKIRQKQKKLEQELKKKEIQQMKRRTRQQQLRNFDQKEDFYYEDSISPVKYSELQERQNDDD